MRWLLLPSWLVGPGLLPFRIGVVLIDIEQAHLLLELLLNPQGRVSSHTSYPSPVLWVFVAVSCFPFNSARACQSPVVPGVWYTRENCPIAGNLDLLKNCLVLNVSSCTQGSMPNCWVHLSFIMTFTAVGMTLPKTGAKLLLGIILSPYPASQNTAMCHTVREIYSGNCATRRFLPCANITVYFQWPSWSKSVTTWTFYATPDVWGCYTHNVTLHMFYSKHFI